MNPEPGAPLKILLVEDQTMVRELLANECRYAFPGATVVAAGDGASGLQACRELQPDIIILDLVLTDGDGLEFLPGLFAAAPKARVITLSSRIDEFTLHRASALRVHGIIDKNEQPVRILREAIETVRAGKPYHSAAVQRLRASLRADPFAFDKILSDREQEVMRLIGDGLSNEDIAQRLNVGASTAKKHRLAIMAKLDLHSTPQLMRYAIEKGFTRVPDARFPRGR